MDKYTVKIIGVFAAIFTLFVCSCLFVGMKAEEYMCSVSWQDSGYESRFVFPGSCQVLEDGRWLPSNSFRTVTP